MQNFIPIEGYEDDYMINNEGVIISIKNGVNKVLKQSIDTPGYKYVRLNKKNHRVHRLIAIHFIQKIEGKPWVNHINGIKTDNSISNLEWCTPSENMIHATKMGLNYGLKKGKNPSSRKVINTKTKEVFDCAVSACQTTSFKYETFIAMLGGRFRNKSTFEWL